MPPRPGCALCATEVPGAGSIQNLVRTRINEHILPIRTLRPIQPGDKRAGKRSGAEALVTPTDLCALSPVGAIASAVRRARTLTEC